MLKILPSHVPHPRFPYPSRGPPSSNLISTSCHCPNLCHVSTRNRIPLCRAQELCANLLSKPTTSIDMHRQKIEILTLRLSLRKLKLSRARQCPSVHPVSVVEGSQAWRWEAWEPRDSTYNMHLRKSQPENHRHVVEYAFNLLPGRKSERLPCHPCSAWQAPCERAVHLIYPSAPLSFSATSSATAVSFTIEFVQLQ